MVLINTQHNNGMIDWHTFGQNVYSHW